MTDIQHTFGSDLTVGPTGDLAISTGTQAGQERVLRRLLTNPGDYIWDLTYGAGLGGMIGQPANPASIRAVVLSQIFAESCVARSPAPVVNVTSNSAGAVAVSILYADATTGATQTLTVPAV